MTSSSKKKKMFNLASKVAIKRIDRRDFFIAAIAERSDGVVVVSRNEAAMTRLAEIHAEARVSKKLDYGAVVYVVRMVKVKKGNPEFAMAKPCYSCQKFLKSKKVKKVYFTTGPDSWDQLEL